MTTSYRLRVGPFYFGDPEVLGLCDYWTSDARQAVGMSIEQAITMLRTAVNIESNAGKPVTIEPIVVNN